MQAEGVAGVTILQSLFQSYFDRVGFEFGVTYLLENGVIVFAIDPGCDMVYRNELYDVSDFVQTAEEQKAFNQLLMQQTSGEIYYGWKSTVSAAKSR